MGTSKYACSPSLANVSRRPARLLICSPWMKGRLCDCWACQLVDDWYWQVEALLWWLFYQEKKKQHHQSSWRQRGVQVWEGRRTGSEWAKESCRQISNTDGWVKVRNYSFQVKPISRLCLGHEIGKGWTQSVMCLLWGGWWKPRGLRSCLKEIITRGFETFAGQEWKWRLEVLKNCSWWALNGL